MIGTILSRYFKNDLNAGPKAKLDVEKIFKDNLNFEVITIPEPKNPTFIQKVCSVIISVLYAIYSKRHKYVCYQYPFSGKAMNFHKKNSICFIHDINGLRYNKDDEFKTDMKYINMCENIVVHNNSMKKLLIENGIEKNKIHILELFDYLANDKLNEKYKVNKKNIKLIYPGNLNRDKSPFLYQLDESKMKYELNIYGKGYDSNNKNKKVVYKGTFNPDSPSSIEGDIGLVWDGNYDESDENVGFKNYTKYNNPHKVSCCMAVGIPVIVWEKSAIAEFVKKNNVGYTINNIYDINNIDFSDYDIKRKNAIEIGKKVRNGYYTRKIINEIIGK